MSGSPAPPKSMTPRAARTGVRKRVFSWTIIATPEARQVSTIATQVSQLGASGFCTIRGSRDFAASSTRAACDCIVVAISTKSSFSRLSISSAL